MCVPSGIASAARQVLDHCQAGGPKHLIDPDKEERWEACLMTIIAFYHILYIYTVYDFILIDYAELHCLSNFTFLRGASHPEELVQQAHALGIGHLP